MSNDYQRINIAVKLPENIFREAIKLSREISKGNQAHFVLDGISFIPHITLYSPEYPSKNTDGVLEKVGRVIKDNSAFIVHPIEIRFHLGYIDIAFKKTTEWLALHKSIVNKLNPFRENHLREKYSDSEELKQYSDQQQEYIKKYGYPEVFDSFTPHLTLSRLEDEKAAEKVTASLDFLFREFQVDTLAAFTMGKHGTCHGILKEWNLGDI